MPAFKREPVRVCCGCRERGPQRELLRLIRDEDGSIVVDARGSALGRGAWVHGTAACLALAARGGLARSYRAPVTVTADELVALVRVAALRRVEGLVAAARRAGKLALGTAAVHDAIQLGTAKLLLVASDARAAIASREVQGLIAEGRAVAWADKARLGAWFGRDELGVVAVTDAGLADAVGQAARWAMASPPQGSPEAGSGSRTRRFDE